MKFSIKDFFSKCDQIRRKLFNWSHLLKISFTENFSFCAVVNTRLAYFTWTCLAILLTNFSRCGSRVDQGDYSPPRKI